MFSFLSSDKPGGIDKRTLKSINNEVIHFLEIREVMNFKVYTLDYEHNPVVLIQAIPQKKLRFSNILEIQIKRHLKEKLGFQVPAVFWRFKMDEGDDPGPEQADYNYEEKPGYPQDQSPSGVHAATISESSAGSESGAEAESINHGENYDVRHLARKGMEVEEISMGEFDEFLKGASGSELPQP
jgi:hypothetical protein